MGYLAHHWVTLPASLKGIGFPSMVNWLPLPSWDVGL